MLFNNTSKAEIALLSTNSSIAVRSIPPSFNFFNAGNNWSAVFTDPPNALDKPELESANFKNTVLNAVPAIDPLIPAFANPPNNAVVPSTLKPTDLATGAT